MSKKFKLTKTERTPNSEIVIEGEINWQTVEFHREKVLKDLQARTNVPGFRKGHVPNEVLITRLGEMTILGEAAEGALNEVYPEIVEDEKLFVIGSPKVSITKLAPQNPLGFSIKVAIMPEIKLPDYKKIASREMKEKEDVSVTEKEVDDVIDEIRKNYAHVELHKKAGHEKHDHGEIPKEDYPEINDEFVKKIGNFKNVAEFKEKAKENIKAEKESRNKEKRITATLDAIMSETKMAIPEVLVESELAKMLAQFKDDLARAGADYDAYLKEVKKTEDEIKKDWRETAEKKAKAQLILNKISEVEKISPDNDKVRAETTKLLTIYKDADPVRARSYVAQMLLNEEVMSFLENQK